MRFRLMLSAGVVVALTIGFPALHAHADGPILSRIHAHHAAGPKDITETVRIPGREIRVVTSRPHVIVSEGGSARMRGFFPATTAVQGPFVATFLPMTVSGTFGTQVSAGSTALESVHALERQTLEFARQKASLKAEMDHVESAYKRVHANLTAPGSASESELKKSIDELTKRVSDIERLLIIHDNVLKKVAPNLPKE